MTEDAEATELPDWELSDKKILRLFVITFAIFFVIVTLILILALPNEELDVFGIIGFFFFILVFSFIIGKFYVHFTYTYV